MLNVVIFAAILAFVEPNNTVDDFYQLSADDINGNQVNIKFIAMTYLN